MKRKTFFSHLSGSLGSSMCGVLGHMARFKAQFVCCHLPLLDMPCPPTLVKAFFFFKVFEVVMFLNLLVFFSSHLFF